MAKTKILVTGAGGFIGSHLVTFLKKKGYWVRGVDIKRSEYKKSDADEFKILDMRDPHNCAEATKGVKEELGTFAFPRTSLLLIVELQEHRFQGLQVR